MGGTAGAAGGAGTAVAAAVAAGGVHTAGTKGGNAGGVHAAGTEGGSTSGVNTAGTASRAVVAMAAGGLATRTTGTTGGSASGAGVGAGVDRTAGTAGGMAAGTTGGSASGAGVDRAGVCGMPGGEVIVIIAPLIIIIVRVLIILVAPIGLILQGGLGLWLPELGETAGEGTAALHGGHGVGAGSDGDEVRAAVGGLGEVNSLVVKVEDGVDRLQEGVTEDSGGTLESAEDAEVGAGDVDDKVRDRDADDLVGEGEVDGAGAGAAVDAVKAGGGVELGRGEGLEERGEDGGREGAQRGAAVEEDGLAGAGVDLGGGTTGLGDGDLIELDEPPSLTVGAGDDSQLGQVTGVLLGIDTTEDDGAWRLSATSAPFLPHFYSPLALPCPLRSKLKARLPMSS